MKIKSLFISKYKNIPEKEIIFETDLTSLIIGQNGLGKSNLLEAISLIFVAISDDEDIPFKKFDNKYFSFRITYTLRDNEIDICYGLNQEYYVSIDNDKYIFKKGETYNLTDVKKLTHLLIPDYIISYYSGQNVRLEKIFSGFQDKYIQGLKANYDNNKLTSRRNFLYLKSYHAPLLLLTLSIFSDYEKKGVKIYHHQYNSLLKYLNIESLESFSLNLVSPYWVKFLDDDNQRLKAGYVSYIHTTIDSPDKYPYPFWQLKSSLHSFLKCLTHTSDIVPYTNEDEITKKSDFREIVEFNNVRIDEFKLNLYKEFESPLELFYTLESLVLLDIIDLTQHLKFDIKKNSDLSITYDLLSEGENQLLITLGTILLTGEEETLFLFDEPDTYLNPKWQREYIGLLEEFSLDDDDSHIVATTHSPLLVQNIEGDEKSNYDLFLLYRTKENEVSIDTKHHVEKNWRLDQVLTSKYFDIGSARPASLDEFMKARLEIIRKGNLGDDDIKRLKVLENEFGYLPTGETILDIESLAFLKSLTNKK